MNRGGSLLKFLLFDLFALLCGIATVGLLYYLRQSTVNKPNSKDPVNDLAVEIWAGRIVYFFGWRDVMHVNL